MTSFQIKEQILAPPEEVFAFITSTENAPLVNRTIRQTERLDEGPLQAGARYKQTRSFRGHEVSSEYEVVQYAPPERFSVQSEKEGVRSVYLYELTSLGSGTEITLTTQVEAEGARGLLAWIVGQYMKRRDRDLLERIELEIIKSQT